MKNTNARLGQNLESACRSYQATKSLRLANAADNLAAEAERYPVGSPEWKALVRQFVQVCETADDNGMPIIK